MKTIKALVLNFAVFIQVLGGATEAAVHGAPQVRSAETKATQRSPAGELRLHPENSRYFVDAGRHSARPLNDRWYNPRTGEWSKPFEVRPAPVSSLSCPDNNDWTLHLKVKP